MTWVGKLQKSSPTCRQGHHAAHDRNGVVRQVQEILQHLRQGRTLGPNEVRKLFLGEEKRKEFRDLLLFVDLFSG